MIRKNLILCVLMISALTAYAQESNFRHIIRNNLDCFVVPSSYYTGLKYRFIYKSRDFKAGQQEGRAEIYYAEECLSPYLDTLKDTLLTFVPKDCLEGVRVDLNVYVNRDGELLDFEIYVHDNTPPEWLTDELAEKLYHFFASQKFPPATKKLYDLLLSKQTLGVSRYIGHYLYPPKRK